MAGRVPVRRDPRGTRGRARRRSPLYSAAVTARPSRARRADPPPIPRVEGPAASIAAESAGPRPWNAERIVRGVRRRTGLALDVVRDRWLLPIVARSEFL